MGSDELKALWVSDRNGMPEEHLRAYVSGAVDRVRRDQRKRKGLLIWSIAMMTLLTGNAAYQLTVHDIGWDAWSMYLMFAAQWFVVYRLLRIYKQQRVGSAGASIRDSLETIARHASARVAELSVLLGLFIVVVPLLGFAIMYLQDAGKMRPNEAASAAVAGGTILLGAGSYIAYELFGRAKPEARRVTSLLKQYE